jgi:hypothetical protein
LDDIERDIQERQSEIEDRAFSNWPLSTNLQLEYLVNQKDCKELNKSKIEFDENQIGKLK